MTTPDLALRGHHFLCTLHYQGAGYSTGFTGNMTALCTGIAERGESVVEVAAMADPICSACPSLQPDGQQCATQDSVMRRDRALLDAMGWVPGQTMSLEAAYWAVLDRRDELMADVCTGCEWLPRCTEKGPNGMASPLTRGLSRPS
jgi:hypothetical protein